MACTPIDQRRLDLVPRDSAGIALDIVEDIAGVRLKRRYQLDAPKGVRGRNSDNTLIRQVLGWAPSTTLRDGMERTYRWVYDQVKAQIDGRPAVDDTAS